jgi:hypothetical protein
MTRRTIEAVCADKGATGKNLLERIKNLKINKSIEGRLVEWSHDLQCRETTQLTRPQRWSATTTQGMLSNWPKHY